MSVTLILICWTLPYVSICLHLFIDIYSKYVFDYDAWSLAVCCSWTLLTFWFFLGSFNDNIRTVLLCYKKMPSSGKNLKLNWWCLSTIKSQNILLTVQSEWSLNLFHKHFPIPVCACQRSAQILCMFTCLWRSSDDCADLTLCITVNFCQT